MLQRKTPEISLNNAICRGYDYEAPIVLNNQCVVQMVQAVHEKSPGMIVDVIDLKSNTVHKKFFQAPDHGSSRHPFLLCAYDETHCLFSHGGVMTKLDVTDASKTSTLQLGSNIKNLKKIDDTTLVSVHFPNVTYSKLLTTPKTLSVWNISDKENPVQEDEFKLPSGLNQYFHMAKVDKQLFIADKNIIHSISLIDGAIKTFPTLKNISEEKSISSFLALPNKEFLIGDRAGKISFYKADDFSLIQEFPLYRSEQGDHNAMRATLLNDGKHALIYNSHCFNDFSLLQIWNLEKRQVVETASVINIQGAWRQPRHLEHIEILENDSAFVYSPASGLDSSMMATIKLPSLEPRLSNNNIGTMYSSGNNNTNNINQVAENISGLSLTK